MSVARAADFMPGPTVTLLGLLNKGRRRIEPTAWALLFFVRNPFILLDGAVIHMLLLVDQAEAGENQRFPRMRLWLRLAYRKEV